MIDEAVFKSNNRFLSNNNDIKNIVEQLNKDDKYSGLVDKFFGKPFISFPADGILRLSGSKPSSSYSFLYDALNGTVISRVPYIVAMDYCADFLDLYNGDVQDRSHFVSINQHIVVSDYTVVLFIILLAYRNSFSLFTPELTFIDGILSLKFEIVHSVVDVLSIENNVVYDFLVNKLKLQSPEMIKALFNDLDFNKDGRMVTITKMFYSRKRTEKERRILDFIESMGEASASEVADYFSLSKRTAIYILKELQDSKQIEKTGKPNDSHLKYRRK